LDVSVYIRTFAAKISINCIMCTYNLKLDDQLVAEAEHALGNTGTSFQLWLEQQVEALLREQVNRKRRHDRVRKPTLTDEQLAERLSQYAPLADSDFPDLSKSDYENYVRSNSGRISKELKKWL
jgi:hypothetical protein